MEFDYIDKQGYGESHLYLKDYYIIGEIIMWPTNRPIPSGFLPCDGTSYSTTTYSDLDTVIGTKYGVAGTLPKLNTSTSKDSTNATHVYDQNTVLIKGCTNSTNEIRTTNNTNENNYIKDIPQHTHNANATNNVTITSSENDIDVENIDITNVSIRYSPAGRKESYNHGGRYDYTTRTGNSDLVGGHYRLYGFGTGDNGYAWNGGAREDGVSGAESRGHFCTAMGHVHEIKQPANGNLFSDEKTSNFNQTINDAIVHFKGIMIYSVRHHRSDGGYEPLNIFHPTTSPNTLENDKDKINYVKLDITGDTVFTTTIERHGTSSWWEFNLRKLDGSNVTHSELGGSDTSYYNMYAFSSESDANAYSVSNTTQGIQDIRPKTFGIKYLIYHGVRSTSDNIPTSTGNSSSNSWDLRSTATLTSPGAEDSVSQGKLKVCEGGTTNAQVHKIIYADSITFTDDTFLNNKIIMYAGSENPDTDRFTDVTSQFDDRFIVGLGNTSNAASDYGDNIYQLPDHSHNISGNVNTSTTVPCVFAVSSNSKAFHSNDGSMGGTINSHPRYKEQRARRYFSSNNHNQIYNNNHYEAMSRASGVMENFSTANEFYYSSDEVGQTTGNFYFPSDTYGVVCAGSHHTHTADYAHYDAIYDHIRRNALDSTNGNTINTGVYDHSVVQNTSVTGGSVTNSNADNISNQPVYHNPKKVLIMFLERK